VHIKPASDLLQACHWPVLPVQSTTASSTNPSSLTLASRFEHQRFLNWQPSSKVQLDVTGGLAAQAKGEIRCDRILYCKELLVRVANRQDSDLYSYTMIKY
jgi:hypothetical protein